MKVVPTLLALVVLAIPGAALARGGGHHSGGHHSGGYHSGGHRFGGHSSSYRSGRVYGFRTAKCKSAACFRKHPGGTYVHPLTERKHP